MNDILKRRAIASRIANPSEIPTYRRLLKNAGNAHSGHIDTNQKKLAIFLVSALLDIMTEDDIIKATGKPVEPQKTANTSISTQTPIPATAAVKKKPGLKHNSIRESTGKTWIAPWFGQRTLSSRIRSIWADGSQKMKAALKNLKPRHHS